MNYVASGTPENIALAQQVNTRLRADAKYVSARAFLLRATGLGAFLCLTGAGIAGCVIALCREEDVELVRSGVSARLRGSDYPALSRRGRALSEKEIAEAVVVNAAPMGACELPWPTG